MTLLVFGRAGQVATALGELGDAECLRLVGRSDVDLMEHGSAARMIAQVRPTLVINVAAYTAVDRAESEPDQAMRINGVALGEIGTAAAEIGAPVVHLSTDYVFDGRGDGAWRESDQKDPVNTYGLSKLVGEESLRSTQPDHLILRTSWVYSATGANFVRTMLRLGADRDEVRVVADQRGCPTSARDLAKAILDLATRRRAGDSDGWGHTYHLTGTGACSWADFAVHVFAVSGSLGGPVARVVPITTDEFPTPARRPANSVLYCTAAAERFGVKLPSWRQSSAEVVAKILESSGGAQ